MSAHSAKIATVCECIDHCFAYAMWCADFAVYVEGEDMKAGLDRAFEIVSDAARLQSFLALRKVDNFLGGVKSKPDDLTAVTFAIDVPAVLGDTGNKLLTAEERDKINKGVAHLTDNLTLDENSEVDLQAILDRSIPVMVRLVLALRKADAGKNTAVWLDRTQALLERSLKCDPT